MSWGPMPDLYISRSVILLITGLDTPRPVIGPIRHESDGSKKSLKIPPLPKNKKHITGLNVYDIENVFILFIKTKRLNLKTLIHGTNGRL